MKTNPIKSQQNVTVNEYTFYMATFKWTW